MGPRWLIYPILSYPYRALTQGGRHGYRGESPCTTLCLSETQCNFPVGKRVSLNKNARKKCPGERCITGSPSIEYLASTMIERCTVVETTWHTTIVNIRLVTKCSITRELY